MRLLIGLIAVWLATSATSPSTDETTVPGMFRVEKRRLVGPDGQNFVWRGVTAFRLLDYIADGQERKTIDFLDWARASGFNVVRVLAMNAGWLHLPKPEQFLLTPDDGRKVLPRLFALARERGLYVHVVAIAGSGEMPVDLEAHVKAVGQIVLAADNAVVEIANEPGHGSQSPKLRDPAYVERLGALLPPAVVWIGGAGDAAAPGPPRGDIVTRHLNRDSDEWNMIRRLRDLEASSFTDERPYLSGEPIGAGEAVEPGRRLTNPAIFYAYGVLCRIMTIACTFHMEDGLQAVPPRPKQAAAARAFIEGTRVASDQTVFAFKNAGWEDSPVAGAAFDRCAVRAYSGLSGDDGLVAVIGEKCDPQIQWKNGWRAVGEVSQPYAEISVVRIRRARDLGHLKR